MSSYLSFCCALFFIMLACSQGSAHAQTLGELLPKADDLYRPDPEPCTGETPLAGAREVKVVVRDNKNAWLVGLAGERVVWKKQFVLKEELNTPKTYPSCKGRTVELYSQFPFSAGATIQTFNWDGETLRFVSMRREDPSAEFVEAAIKAAESGDARKLKAIFTPREEGDIGVLYPHRYINNSTLADAIRRGHAAALKLLKEGRSREAAERLSLMFDTTADLSNLSMGEVEAKDGRLGRWLAVWKAEEIDAKDYLTALNDYGYFLQQAGDNRAALPVFEAVVRLAPQRAVARLNLADSLWALGDVDDAKRQYQLYQHMMTADDKRDRIPARVAERLK
ncbi:MAG TPA: tetratricopeptide repeat protein [Pyrinomonadaceae bacterium]